MSFVQPSGLCAIKTFQSILNNYSALLELWETILNDKPDSETRAQVNGIDNQMKTFRFHFEASLLHNLLSHTDKTSWHTRLNAAEGQHLVRMMTTTLKSITTEERYKLFWQKTIMQANKLGIAEPTLTRKHKAPRPK